MTDFNIENEYNELRKKYKNLPNFNTLNEEFELWSIDKKPFISRAVRRRLNEKLIFYCRVLEGVLFPTGQSHISNYESDSFPEEEKEKFHRLYKELMVFERKSLLLDVEPNEKEDINFIINLTKKWPSFKSEVKTATKKMVNIWDTSKSEVEEHYFG